MFHPTFGIQTAPNTAPLGPVAEALANTVGRKEAAAKKVWKEAVVATAENKELTKKQLDDLADALFTLNRTAAEFDGQVNKYRTLLAHRKTLAEQPTREEDKAERARIEARNKELKELIPSLQAEMNHNAQRHQWLGTIRVRTGITIEQLERDLAEIFAAD